MVERAVALAVGVTVVAVVLAATLPKLIPAATLIFIFLVIGRVVWWYTR
jgi:hypothetical protein